MQLMVKKYVEAHNNKYKMKANREFMWMQKVVILHQKAPTVITAIDTMRRVEIFDDELRFNSNKSKIDFVQLSSIAQKNFMLIAMDGIVYKYDLVTRELLF